MSIEVMKMALDALEENDGLPICNETDTLDLSKEITALRAAIAEASMQRLTDVQQETGREPLSIETINKLWNDAVGWGDASSNEVTFVRTIERAHGIGEVK